MDFRFRRTSVPDETASRGDGPHRLPRVAIAAAALGNATEWFDYGIYADGLAYISASLFPGNMGSATLFALGTFAIPFLIRPLGGPFWGPLGDRLGHKRVLALTVLTMSGATLLVGVLPTYASAGWLSDRVGRKAMWWISLVGLFVAAVPMFTLMTHGVLGTFVGFAVPSLLYVPQLATISAMFPAMLPTHVLYAGMAIA